MKCVRALLRQQCVRLREQSARPAARCGAPLPLPPASSGRPGVLHESQHQVLRSFHSGPACRSAPADSAKRDKSLITHDDLFDQAAKKAKVKATFNKVLDVFTQRDIRRRGHVEFIYAALRRMPEFGVEKDLAVYNKLLDIFPKEVFVPRNFIQRMFNHYPRQQECGVQVLEQMENYGITPNVETKVLLVQIFGEKSHPIRKFQRIMYWFPKFKHANPYPVPKQLPEDPVDLARFSLARIANDLDAKVSVYQLPCTDVTESGEERTLPHIVGIQSPSQMELLDQHNPSRPVFVEGPFPLWLRRTLVYYYILRADPLPPDEQVEQPYDPERCLYYPLQLQLDLERDFGDEETFDVDDLDEGPVFAMCMTSLGDQAALNQWISGLQQSNPILGRVPTLFRLSAGSRELRAPADAESAQHHHHHHHHHHHSPEAESRRDESQPEEEPEVIVEAEPERRRGMKQ